MKDKKDSYIRDIFKNIQKMKYISPDEIPDIDLYMDQVITFMDEHLKMSRRFEEDKLITKTMINNYTKNNLLPPPNKKKYNKEHILLMIFIYYFKNILSINDIRSIFEPLSERFYDGNNEEITLEEIYEEVFGNEKEQIDDLVKDIIRKYRKATKTFSEETNPEDREFLTTFLLICSLSFDVYVKKMVVEKLIDDRLGTAKEKAESGEKTKEKKASKSGEKAKDGKTGRNMKKA